MKQTKLRICGKDIQQLLLYAEADLPLESVALLFGRYEQSTCVVTGVEQVQNVSDSGRTSFMVNPEEQWKLMLNAESRDEHLVAIFHSHPALPQPSSRDIRNMQLNPVIWLIASKSTGEWVYRAFILANGSPMEIPIVLH